MNINATLLGQMITFAVFVWFTMRFIWPPITKVMKERQQKIADGLAAAQQGKRDLELAARQAKKLIADAKLEASHILERAHDRAKQSIKDAKDEAHEEAQRMLARASEQIDQQINSAREVLRVEVANIAMLGAEKVIGRTIDPVTHTEALQQLANELL